MGTTVNCSTGVWQSAPAMPPQIGEPWAQATVPKRRGWEGRPLRALPPPRTPRVPPDPSLAAAAPHMQECLEAGLTSCPRWSVPGGS